MNKNFNLKSRHIRTLIFLLDKDYPVSTEKIAKEIGVSRNTLKHDLNIIADYIVQNGLTMVRKPHSGIFINGSNKKKNELLEKLSNIKNKKEYLYDKKSALIKLFLTSEKLPTIEDICELLSISRPTTVKYLKSVKEWFNEREILIKGKPGVGYIMMSKEESIRNAFVDFINTYKKDFIEKLMEVMFQEKNRDMPFYSFHNIDFICIRNFIRQIEAKTSTTLTDKDFLNLALKIAVSAERIKRNHFVVIESKKLFNIMQNPIYKIIYNHKYIIETDLNVNFPPEEVAFITLSFISSKVQESSALKSFHSKTDDEYINYAIQIAKMTKEIFNLSIEKDSEFVHMLALHLKSTLNKIKYGIKIENPLLLEIKEEYPLSFSIAEKVASMLSNKIQIKIPEEETGYIALYISMAVEKLKHERRKRKKIAVVCAMAMGTSSLLFWRLLNEMPDVDVVQVGSYKDVVEGKIDPEIDLIVSTIPLPKLTVPYVVVSPFLNTSERRKIREILGIVKQKPIAQLSNNLDENLIFPQVSVSTENEIIKLLGNKLYKAGYVKKGFVRAVIKREKVFPTGLDTIIPIALPHAGAEYTIKQGIAIATLKNPIPFTEMANGKEKLPVRLVIMPVLTLKNEDNAIFYEILQKCRNPKTANQLLSAKTAHQIKKILTTSTN